MISARYADMSLGDRETTDWAEVTGDYVRDFAELTGDRHPLHLDPDYAAESMFGRQIAHGALLLSTLLGQVTLDPRYFHAFYGIERLRFLHPVFFGDQVRTCSEVVDIRDRSDGTTSVVTCRGVLENQDETPVLEANLQFLVPRDPTDA
ncbi:MAG TPA: MaoC family dehydratase N-terminal domain-containing protein [Candidatus Corynebacterium avicola]|uniref:MaoC family dehydratase N-terminal domain-containing protein n=1 Tax=Candidatus Corynebacterium avicola TaxID=2838527 RepID=A0A9D1RPE9_9CORY|nr:MaoC family dehydratase N-terminal domain-containing protein [Candidatus Corynebacterium avicola]